MKLDIDLWIISLGRCIVSDLWARVKYNDHLEDNSATFISAQIGAPDIRDLRFCPKWLPPLMPNPFLDLMSDLFQIYNMRIFSRLIFWHSWNWKEYESLRVRGTSWCSSFECFSQDFSRNHVEIDWTGWIEL